MSNIVYFKTSNATRTYRAGGFDVNFPKILFSGGSWFGAIGVEESGLANALREYGPPVYEITEEEFNSLKKKLPVGMSSCPESPQPPVAEKDAEVVESLDEALLMGTADSKDPLEAETPKPKPRRRKRKTA